MEGENSQLASEDLPLPVSETISPAESSANEERLQSELKRLKDHLIHVEEEYTQEILAGEQREAELRKELDNYQQLVSELRDKLAEVSQNSIWQEKLNAAINERDKALNDVSKLDDKVHRLTASMTNLQLVIEQMQIENEKKLAAQAKQHAAAIEAQIAVQNNLKAELEKYELKCQETNQALQAASRLTERIDQKESIIQKMKQEIVDKSNRITQLEKETADAQANYETKVDKQIIKNLLLGYFGAPNDKKRDVEAVLAKILDFTKEEMQKVGLNISQHHNSSGRLFASPISQSPSAASSNGGGGGDEANTSLGEMFIKFLENESNPKPRRASQSNINRELARDFTRVAFTPNRSSTNIFSDSRSKYTSPLNNANGSTSASIFTPATSTLFVPSSTTSRASPSTTPSSAINNILTSSPSINLIRSSPGPEHHLQANIPPAPFLSTPSPSSSRKPSLSESITTTTTTSAATGIAITSNAGSNLNNSLSTGTLDNATHMY